MTFFIVISTEVEKSPITLSFPDGLYLLFVIPTPGSSKSVPNAFWGGLVEESPLTLSFPDGLPIIRRSTFAEEPHPTFYNSRYTRLRILSNAPLGMTIYMSFRGIRGIADYFFLPLMGFIHIVCREIADYITNTISIYF